MTKSSKNTHPKNITTVVCGQGDGAACVQHMADAATTFQATGLAATSAEQLASYAADVHVVLAIGGCRQ